MCIFLSYNQSELLQENASIVLTLPFKLEKLGPILYKISVFHVAKQIVAFAICKKRSINLDVVKPRQQHQGAKIAALGKYGCQYQFFLPISSIDPFDLIVMLLPYNMYSELL